MSKRFHIFLMTSILIFSFFFIGSVKAAYKVYNGVTYDENKITELARRAFNDNTFEPNNYYVTMSFEYYNSKNYFHIMFSDIPMFFENSNNSVTYYDNQAINDLNLTYHVKDFEYNPNTNNIFNIHTNTTVYHSVFRTNSYNSQFWSNYPLKINNSTRNASLNFVIPIYDFNFHLNGGILENDQIEFITGEDFSLSLYQNEFEDFINNSTLEKKDMIFENWYYDEELTQPFSIYDTINSDTTLYAKYRYKTAEDFINKNNFNEYDYDQNYDFALINRGDNSDSVYIGLPFNVFDLEIYEYNEEKEEVKEGASACPVPIYIKDGYYYYDINTLYTNSQEILILPKTYFDNLSSENYHFYLSSNAYINYTNDLSEATIVNSSGETIQANFENSYEISRQYQETFKNKENNFAFIKAWISTLSKTTSIFSDIFQYTFNSFNETTKGFFTYIFLVIIFMTFLSMLRRF